MRSAELPADLATIAREATRNGSQLAPARTARITGLGHQVPPEVVPNADIAPRIGVDDAWIHLPGGRVADRPIQPVERRFGLGDEAIRPVERLAILRRQ